MRVFFSVVDGYVKGEKEKKCFSEERVNTGLNSEALRLHFNHLLQRFDDQLLLFLVREILLSLHIRCFLVRYLERERDVSI